MGKNLPKKLNIQKTLLERTWESKRKSQWINTANRIMRLIMWTAFVPSVKFLPKQVACKNSLDTWISLKKKSLSLKVTREERGNVVNKMTLQVKALAAEAWWHEPEPQNPQRVEVENQPHSIILWPPHTSHVWQFECACPHTLICLDIWFSVEGLGGVTSLEEVCQGMGLLQYQGLWHSGAVSQLDAFFYKLLW